MDGHGWKKNERLLKHTVSRAAQNLKMDRLEILLTHVVSGSGKRSEERLLIKNQPYCLQLYVSQIDERTWLGTAGNQFIEKMKIKKIPKVRVNNWLWEFPDGFN